VGSSKVLHRIGRHTPEILEYFELVVNTVSMEEALQEEHRAAEGDARA